MVTCKTRLHLHKQVIYTPTLIQITFFCMQSMVIHLTQGSVYFAAKMAAVKGLVETKQM